MAVERDLEREKEQSHLLLFDKRAFKWAALSCFCKACAMADMLLVKMRETQWLFGLSNAQLFSVAKSSLASEVGIIWCVTQVYDSVCLCSLEEH